MNTKVIDALVKKLFEEYNDGCSIDYSMQYYPAYKVGKFEKPSEMKRVFVLWVNHIIHEEFDNVEELINRVCQITSHTIGEIIVEEDVKEKHRWTNLN